MAPMEELMRYVGFTAEDGERLRSLRPFVMPEAPGIAGRFYERVLRFPAAAAVFADTAQVDRLKSTLVRWLNEALAGPWDDAYHDVRLRIGRIHVRVGLQSQYMFTAMNRLMEEVHAIAYRQFPDEACAFGESLRKLTDIELAIMLGTYIEAREQDKVAGLRDLLVSHLRSTVLLVDVHKHIVTATPGGAGFFSLVGAVGQPLAHALHPALVEEAQLTAHLDRAIATGREVVLPRLDVELDGQHRSVRIAIVPLHHDAANALIQIEDLTETIAAESRALHAEHLATLGTMAASVAHEIRNPLAGISAAVQVVASSLPTGDPRAEALGEVRGLTTRLGDLVGDLLSFARPPRANLREVDLRACVDAAVTHADAASACEVSGAGQGHCDEGLLQHIVVNLVQNALQAGAKRVHVVVAPARVTVFDDGPGIPTDLRDRIFEPFFTTKVRGTGLGLPLSRNMVKAMDGALALVSSPLGGAGFELRLVPMTLS